MQTCLGIGDLISLLVTACVVRPLKGKFTDEETSLLLDCQCLSLDYYYYWCAAGKTTDIHLSRLNR